MIHKLNHGEITHGNCCMCGNHRTLFFRDTDNGSDFCSRCLPDVVEVEQMLGRVGKGEGSSVKVEKKGDL
jgi:hypothetical protein